MSSPLVDASSGVTDSSNSNTTVTWTHTTTQASSVLLVGVLTSIAGGGAAPVVTSVSSSGLASFAKRKASNVTGINSFVVGAIGFNLELWWAPVPSTGTYTISVSVASAALVIAAASVNLYGLCDPSVYYDGNGAVPASAFNKTTTVNTNLVTYSTSEADDLIIGVLGSGAQTPQCSGFSLQALQGNSAASTVLFIGTLSVSAVQSSSTVSTNNGSAFANGGCILIVDAATHGTAGVCPGGKFQTFVTIICS